MNHIGLFEGIGGFSIAASWMDGWETIAWCENNPFCQKVLKYHFPKAKAHGDIKTTDFSIYRGQCDIVTAGFPCQPWSQAGKRKGKADDRNLWPETIRAVREIQPGWGVFENVPGLINWGGGMVLNEITADLENEGFEVTSLIIPACGKDAPHKRDRLWIVAYSSRNGQQSGRFGENRSAQSQSESERLQRERIWDDGRRAGQPGNATDTEQSGLQKPEAGQQFNKIPDVERNNTQDVADTASIGMEGRRPVGKQEPGAYVGQGLSMRSSAGTDWSEWPTEPPIRGKYDGLPETMVRCVNPKLYATISERYTDKDLQEVWDIVSKEDVWGQIRGLYKIYDKGILYKVLQLCSSSSTEQKGTSVFSEKASEKILRKLQQYGTLTNSPQGRKLEEQFRIQFNNTLPYLSHEVALVAMEAERATVSFNSWHRTESIMAYGNSVVPQIVYEIFKAIEQTKKYND